MTKIEDLEDKLNELEKNQHYIIELLDEIIYISQNKEAMISPNLMNESNWVPPDRPGLSNSQPIIHATNLPFKRPK